MEKCFIKLALYKHFALKLRLSLNSLYSPSRTAVKILSHSINLAPLAAGRWEMHQNSGNADQHLDLCLPAGQHHPSQPHT